MTIDGAFYARLHANAADNVVKQGPTKYGPMICQCPETDADPTVLFGSCSACGRKPLALMAVAS